MQRPIVHVGYHKTATTWFQKEVYPRSTSHRWIPRAQARKALLDPFCLGFDAGEALATLGSPTDFKPPVICEENLSGYIHNGGLHGLMAPEAARRIKATFPNAVIVIIIRSQPEIIASSYVQYVRGGGTHGIRRYLFGSRWSFGALQYRYKAPRFDLGHFEYDRIVRHYDGLFGKQNVLVLPYEELVRHPEAFLARLEHETGIRFDETPACPKRSNTSFGRATIAIGRLLGLFTARSVVNKTCLLSIPGFYELRRVVLKFLGRLDRAARPEALLGRETLETIRDHYGESNARLMALRDLDLKQLGYPVKPTEAEPAPLVQLPGLADRRPYAQPAGQARRAAS